MQTHLKLRSIREEDFPTLIYLEEYIFPTGSCTPDRLRSIYLSAPYRARFGMMYDNSQTGKLAAMCAILALNREGYRKLQHGECRELELNPVQDYFILPPADKSATYHLEICLHVYHIDKLEPVAGFNKTMLRDLGTIVEDLRTQVHSMYKSDSTLRVHCLSAYSVTKAGVALFESTLGCVEQIEFPTSEHLLFRETKDKDTEWLLVEADRSATPQSLTDANKTWKYSNRCKFLATYPNGSKSIVWNYIQGQDANLLSKL